MQKSGLIVLPDRAVMKLSGQDARSFLQGIITNDIDKVTALNTIYAAMLTPQGKFLFDFFIAEHGSGLLFDCDRARLNDLIKRLTMYKLRANVTIEDARDDYVIASAIGEAGAILPPADVTTVGRTWTLGDGIAFVDPRLARMGVRIMLPTATTEATLSKTGLERLPESAYLRHRLNMGVPAGGPDVVPDKSFLLECNFDEMHGVDHHKGCYIGQETTSRTKRRGSLRKRILPVGLEGPAPEYGTPIMADGKEIGTLLSVFENRAMALVRLERWQQAQKTDSPLLADEARVQIDKPDWLELD